MIKHTQTIRRLLQTHCLSVFDHFVCLVLKELKSTDFLTLHAVSFSLYFKQVGFPRFLNTRFQTRLNLHRGCPLTNGDNWWRSRPFGHVISIYFIIWNLIFDDTGRYEKSRNHSALLAKKSHWRKFQPLITSTSVCKSFIYAFPEAAIWDHFDFKTCLTL